MKKILAFAALLAFLTSCSQYTCPTYSKKEVKKAYRKPHLSAYRYFFTSTGPISGPITHYYQPLYYIPSIRECCQSMCAFVKAQVPLFQSPFFLFP
jgi:hypothetical protein